MKRQWLLIFQKSWHKPTDTGRKLYTKNRKINEKKPKHSVMWYQRQVGDSKSRKRDLKI